MLTRAPYQMSFLVCLCSLLAQSDRNRLPAGLLLHSNSRVCAYVRYREATLHIEIAMQTHPEPLFLADDGTYVDVTNFVRFELQHGDIRYGVLDLIVHFIYRGRRAQCYLLHFFQWMQSKKT